MPRSGGRGIPRRRHLFGRVTEESVSRASFLLERVVQADGQVFHISDGDYPQNLRRDLGKSAPPLLFALGNFDLLSVPSAGIVGSRTATAEGLGLAEGFSR